MATRTRRVELFLVCHDADRDQARALLDTATGEPGFGAGSFHRAVTRAGEDWWVAHGVFTAAAAATIEAAAAGLGAHGLVVRSTRDERDGRTVDDGNPRLSMTRAGATDRVVEERAADPKVIR